MPKPEGYADSPLTRPCVGLTACYHAWCPARRHLLSSTHTTSCLTYTLRG